MSPEQLPAISVKGLSKAFRSYTDRPQSIKSYLVALSSGELFKLKRKKTEVLKDISFDVNRGEIVGIMGRNGSGKTTLLKILAGIYVKDRGEVYTRERVASLVGLGAGFHSELTGYENISLSASILGISRHEIKKLTDEIIEFSELGEKVYEPVKNYSNGMVVRLGFSIACHIDAPILLLDEVLSVGDSGFQKKSLEKIKDMFASGRTILLVTHDYKPVKAYCSRCIVIDKGHIKFDGDPSEGADLYESLFKRKK